MEAKHIDWPTESDRVFQANGLLDNVIAGVMKGELKPEEIVERAVRVRRKRRKGGRRCSAGR